MTIHPQNRTNSKAILIASIALLAPASLFTAKADIRTWNGGGADDNWNTLLNWGGAAPLPGDSLIFAGTIRPTPSNDIAADSSFAGITFASGANPFTLSGNRITLGGDITNDSASLQSIGLDMVLDATRTTNAASGDLALGGVLSGAGGLNKTGNANLTLSGVNTFSGLVTINGGAVSVANWSLSGAAGAWGQVANGAAATTFIQMNGGRINYTGASASGDLRGVNLVSGDNTFDVVAGSTLNFAGAFNRFQSNGGNLIKEGGGTLQIGSAGIANNIFTGKVTINAGALEWFGAGSMPTPGAPVADFITINDGAEFRLTYTGAPTTVSANVGFKVSGNAAFNIEGNHTISGVIGDGGSAGNVVKNGAGLLTFGGANTYSGNTTINAGTLALSGGASLPDSSTVTLAGAPSALDISAISAASETAGALAGVAGSSVVLGGKTLVAGGNDSSTAFAGVISGAGGSVINEGTGTLTLSGANSFTGTVTVEEGTLSITNWNNNGTNGALGNSATPVTLGTASTAGTLRFTGGGSNNQPANIKGLSLADGGGKVEMVYASGNRGENYIHINGDKIAGSGGLTVDTFAGGATSRFIIVGSAPYTGPTVVAPNSELQTNYDVVGDGTPFGAGSNGLGSAVTVSAGGLLTFFSFNNTRTIALGSLSGAGTVQGEGGGVHTFKVGGDDTSTAFTGIFQNNGGPVAITKVGAGTLTLSGASTHTGLVTINGGAISVPTWNLSGAAGPWGSLANNAGAPATTFIQMNSGRINYTGASAAGALRGVNLVSGDNTIDVIAGSTINFGGGFNTFQSNGGNLIKEGGGTLQIGTDGVANNIFTGKVTINDGALDWFGAGSMPTPVALVPDFITINDGGRFQLTFTGAATVVSANIGFNVSGNAGIRSVGTHTIPGIIANGAGAGSITKTGDGTLGVTGANTYTGTLTVEEGTLSTNGWNNNGTDGPLGNSITPITLGGATTMGTLRYFGPQFLPDSGKKGLFLNPGGGKVQLAIGAGRAFAHLDGSSITGSGGLTIETAGARFLIVGSAGYTGPTAVEANSELQANYYNTGVDGTPFGAGLNGLGSPVTLNGNALLTLYSNGASTTFAIGSLSGTGTVRGEAAGAHTLKVGGDGTSTEFSGAITNSFDSGAGLTALTKVGAGTLTLSGVNTHTGATQIASGALLINGSISGSTVTVDGGTLGGTDGTVGPTTVNLGGTLAPGASIGTLNFADSLLLAGASVFEISKSGITLSSDLANVTGALTLGGTLSVTATGNTLTPGDSFDLFDAASFSGGFTSVSLPLLTDDYTWDTASLATAGTITVVPEPGAALSLLGGLGFLAVLRRRRS